MKLVNDNPSVCEKKNFEYIYDEYHKSLYNFLYYRCGDKDRASDLVQEAYIKLWDNCKKVFFDKAKSYLYTVANNRFLTEQAHEKVKLKYKNHVDHKSTTNENPDFLLQEKEFKAQLKNAIENLKEGEREVFLLNRIEKKKFREIAEILDISIKTVEKRMSKALSKLKEELAVKL